MSTLQRPTGCRPAASNIPWGFILLGARASAERAYQDWKWAVDKLWEHKRHCLQTAAHQRLLEKRAAHERQKAACQEAARATQRLLGKQAALECQEAMHHQRILNKEAASCQHAAHAQQMAAARIIFMWLCR